MKNKQKYNTDFNQNNHILIKNNATLIRIVLSFVFILVFIFPSIAQDIVLDTTRKTRPKVGLVLSGGGAKGYAHIGALKVLQEMGIEVDYISGTSMGSLVGALFAIGYSPESIEKIVQEQDWGHLLLDKIDRRDLSLEEKTYNEQQFISFPVSKKSIDLPFGIKYGQSVSLLLSQLVSPVHHFHQFNEYQTPFLCIGTDISNGESVILDKGNLAESLRASMAIPTVFTPITIDGRMLVDGGLVNNFPAKELAERGCDIIIGVDVQTYKDYNIDDLSSITAILDRSAGLYRKALNDTAQLYVDYYIHPDVTGYGVGSFGDYDTLILRGETAAKNHMQELTELANYLRRFPDYNMKVRELQPLTHFVIDTIVIEGNENISTELIMSLFPYRRGDVMEIKDLEKLIKQMYGTLFFNTVKYSFLPGEEGGILVIKVEESSFGRIGVGVHYDSEYKAGLLLTGMFRSVLLDNTLLQTKLGLSENPHLSFNYFQNRGFRPSLGFSTTWSSFSFIDYLNGKEKVGEYRFSNWLVNLYVQSVSKKTFAIGGGAQIDVSSLRNDVGVDIGVDNSTYSQTNLNFYAFLTVDRWDKSFFPHKGGKVDITAVYVSQFLKGGNVNSAQPTTIISGYYDKAIPLFPRWTFRPRINAGFTFGDGIYFGQMFLLGGQGSHYLPGMISFSGLNTGQFVGTQMVSARLRLQYHLLDKHYLMMTLDGGNATINKEDLLDLTYAPMGYGITYGYDSFIGPLELSIMGSNYQGISAFINLGFWF